MPTTTYGLPMAFRRDLFRSHLGLPSLGRYVADADEGRFFVLDVVEHLVAVLLEFVGAALP